MVVDFIWFTDEKVFTVEPTFTSQNDRIYVPVGIKKRFIQPMLSAAHVLDVQQVRHGVSCRIKNGCD